MVNSLEQYGRSWWYWGSEHWGESNWVLDKINVNVSSQDIETCHRIRKSKNFSKVTIVQFVSREHAKKPLSIEKIWKISTEH